MRYGVICLVLLIVVEIHAISHRHNCPDNEVYEPCNHMEELPCWTGKDRTKRVYKNPRKLKACRAVCVCRNNYVREFPGGKCIKTHKCRNLVTNPESSSVSADYNNYDY